MSATVQMHTCIQVLEKELEKVQFKTYDMGHQANQKEMADTLEFLKSVLP